MNKEELKEYLKNNLKVSIEYDGYDSFGDNYKVKLSLEGEEICHATFDVSYDNKFSC